MAITLSFEVEEEEKTAWMSLLTEGVEVKRGILIRMGEERPAIGVSTLFT